MEFEKRTEEDLPDPRLQPFREHSLLSTILAQLWNVRRKLHDARHRREKEDAVSDGYVLEKDLTRRREESQLEHATTRRADEKELTLVPNRVSPSLRVGIRFHSIA